VVLQVCGFNSRWFYNLKVLKGGAFKSWWFCKLVVLQVGDLDGEEISKLM